MGGTVSSSASCSVASSESMNKRLHLPQIVDPRLSIESEKKSIIAMKGHPFTRKTDVATAISTSLRCPVLSLDDFLDVLTPDYFQTCTAVPSLQQPQDLAFQIVCQVAKSNLKKGCKEIIIDSQLSSRSHLNQLIELAESLPQTRLVIIECKTDNTYQWQTEFEKHGPTDENKMRWYKPKNWEDVEKAIQDGFDERSHCYNNVSKLVLDPLTDFRANFDGKMKSSPLIDAVKYMITRDEGDGPDLVMYGRWRQGQYLPSIRELGSCRAGSGHYITSYSEEGLEYDALCKACENQLVMGAAAYTCHHCSLAIHKECAELLDRPSKDPPPNFLPYRQFISESGKFSSYPPPELRFRCSSCQEKDNPSSDSPCGDCLFTTHLKSRQMPTVIRHDCDRHFLSIVLSDLSPHENNTQCKGCGFIIDSSVWYSCKICCVAYHYRCLTEVPVRLDHEHGAHHHHMLLQYSSKEAEDYICDVCFERGDPDRRDPSCWFYSCQQCQYVSHLHCCLDGKTDISKENSVVMFLDGKVRVFYGDH